jgi:murein DD-endopeptidase MepM/ murein hydrolase activator NlpD
MAGTIAAAGWNSANGNYVVIKHNLNGQTVYSFYAHLSSIIKRSGSVNTSTQIGVVGNTGSGSAGEHLHFAFVSAKWNGSYYGYGTYFTGNKTTYGGVTYYNPHYVIANKKLP